jgi:hypothetical protein
MPHLANRWVLPVPLLGKEVQIDLGFRLRSSAIDQFQVSRHLLAMFVGDLFERVANQVHHTELDTGLGRERLNSFR